MLEKELSDAAKAPISRRKEILFTIIFGVVSVLFVLIILEVGVRVFTHPVHAILQTDAKVGTIHKPNFRGFVWNEESQAEEFVITNSLGYIGADEPSAPKEGSRMAFLGDSFTEGLQVDYYETFPFLLEKQLRVASSTSTIKIYNYGVGGTGTFLQLLRYREHVRPYDMDVVGLIFNHNDFTDNLNKIEYDINQYSEGEGRNTGLKSFLLQFALPKFVFGRLQHQVWFLKILDTLGLYELNENLVTQMQEGKEALLEHPEYYSFTFDLIRMMRSEVEADGATFFVALKHIDEREGDPINREQNDRLKEFLEEEKIQYFETSVDFDLPQEEGECLTFGCGGHFTAAGHEELARFLFEELQKHRLLDQGKNDTTIRP